MRNLLSVKAIRQAAKLNQLPAVRRITAVSVLDTYFYRGGV